MMSMSIIGIFIGFAVYVGFFFWIFWYMRMRLKDMAEGKYQGRPIVLFLLGLLGFIVAGFTLFSPFILLVYLAPARSPGLAIFAGIGILAISGLGTIGWIVLMIKGQTEKVERKRFEKANPLPKLQLSILDLFAAAFGFGGYMAFQSGYGNRISTDTASVAALSAWVIIAMACGLYFALDVCRRSLRLQRPVPRLLFVLGVMLYTVMTSLIPAWLSWRAWRFSMYKAGWVLGKDMSTHQDTSQPPSAVPLH